MTALQFFMIFLGWFFVTLWKVKWPPTFGDEKVTFNHLAFNSSSKGILGEAKSSNENRQNARQLRGLWIPESELEHFAGKMMGFISLLKGIWFHIPLEAFPSIPLSTLKSHEKFVYFQQENLEISEQTSIWATYNKL